MPDPAPAAAPAGTVSAGLATALDLLILTLPVWIPGVVLVGGYVLVSLLVPRLGHLIERLFGLLACLDCSQDHGDALLHHIRPVVKLLGERPQTCFDFASALTCIVDPRHKPIHLFDMIRQ